jgi:carbon storage regulator
MLILSRKLNEQIVIGDGIVITVVAIRGGNVRLGIEAPNHVPVHRKEVYEALRQESGRQKAKTLGGKTQQWSSPSNPGDGR